MNDKNDGDRTDHPDGMPSLFATIEPIGNDQVQRISPDELGEVESHTCLATFVRAFSGLKELHADAIDAQAGEGQRPIA